MTGIPVPVSDVLPTEVNILLFPLMPHRMPVQREHSMHVAETDMHKCVLWMEAHGSTSLEMCGSGDRDDGEGESQLVQSGVMHYGRP